MNNYFLALKKSEFSIKKNKLVKKPLLKIEGFLRKKSYKFQAGDIIKIWYKVYNYPYIFEGVCMAVRGNFKRFNLSFILRNVIQGVGIEVIITYFCYRLFKLYLQFFKKKHHNYKHAKLFYIRNRINRQSRVKLE